MKPKLYLFAISHYCEKARWALDYLEIEHELVHSAPGLHMQLSKKWSLPATSLPILETGEGVIQGSAAIIDWAESITRTSRSLTPEQQRDDALARPRVSGAEYGDSAFLPAGAHHPG